MEIIDVYQYIKYIKPELLILIPVLMVLGKFLKTSMKSKANDGREKHIPLILGGISVVLCSSYLAVIVGENISQALISGFVQGILCAGAAVYGHQVFKQYKKKNK